MIPLKSKREIAALCMAVVHTGRCRYTRRFPAAPLFGSTDLPYVTTALRLEGCSYTSCKTPSRCVLSMKTSLFVAKATVDSLWIHLVLCHEPAVYSVYVNMLMASGAIVCCTACLDVAVGIGRRTTARQEYLMPIHEVAAPRHRARPGASMLSCLSC